MKAKAYKQMSVWRVIFTALMLAFTSFSPLLALSASEPDVCEMACCMAEGHCCCATRKPWVKGQKPDGRPIFEQVEITSMSGCPCTPPSSSANFISRESAHLTASDFHLEFHPAFVFYEEPRPHHSVWFTPTPPRAPPTLLIYS